MVSVCLKTLYWIILLFVITHAITLTKNNCGVHQVQDGDQCCDLCPEGSGVIYPCEAGNDTVCEVCVNGETFSNISSHKEACTPCSSCPKNAHIVQECTNNTDTQCMCDDDYYLNVNGECTMCDLCPAGWGASIPCTRTQNTVCSQCTNGTFSKELSDTSNCLVCSVCAPGAQMLQQCSTTEDTICITLPIYRYNDKDVLENSDETDFIQTEHTPKDEKDIDIIPLYCAILGAVVVGLLGYVIMVHYRRMKEKRLIREPHDDVEYSKASAGDSGICVEVDHHHHHHQKITPVFLSSETKIRDLPNTKRKEIEKSFLQSSKDQRDWQGLARELGFNTKKIANCELKSQRDATTPLKQLLNEWGRNDSATVGILIQAMKNLGRHDVLPALNVYNSAELRPLMPPTNIV